MDNKYKPPARRTKSNWITPNKKPKETDITYVPNGTFIPYNKRKTMKHEKDRPLIKTDVINFPKLSNKIVKKTSKLNGWSSLLNNETPEITEQKKKLKIKPQPLDLSWIDNTFFPKEPDFDDVKSESSKSEISNKSIESPNSNSENASERDTASVTEQDENSEIELIDIKTFDILNNKLDNWYNKTVKPTKTFVKHNKCKMKFNYALTTAFKYN